MPILTTSPDRRMEALLRHVARLQAERKREELKREASEARRRARQISIPTTVIGAFLGGGLGGKQETDPGESKIPNIIAGAATGARIGGSIGQAIINEDPASAISTGLQGAAMVASLPELQERGISALDVAMAGQEGLPRLLQNAQVGERQRQNIMLREQHRVAAQDQQLRQMPPGVQAQVYTNNDTIAQAQTEFRLGQIDEEELAQRLEGPQIRNQVLFEQYKPVPPPTIRQELETGTNLFFDENSQTIIGRNGRGGYVFKTLKSDGGAEVQTQIGDRADQIADLEKNRVIGQLQRRIMDEGVDQVKALEEATRRVEKDAGIMATITGQAYAQAQQEVASRLQRFRPARGQPSPEEKQQQQEAAEQQQVQQQVAQQQQQAQAEIQEAQVFFERSVAALSDIAEGKSRDPNDWSEEALSEAVDPAMGLLRSLGVLGPRMTLEQKEALLPLVNLAEAVLNASQKLGEGRGP